MKTHLYRSLLLPYSYTELLHGEYTANNNMQKLQIIQNKILRTICEGDTYTYTALNITNSNEETERASTEVYKCIRQHDRSIIAASGNYDTNMH
jgi:3-deoxy-D-manno-octulosonic-acid transferase